MLEPSHTHLLFVVAAEAYTNRPTDQPNAIQVREVFSGTNDDDDDDESAGVDKGYTSGFAVVLLMLACDGRDGKQAGQRGKERMRRIAQRYCYSRAVRTFSQSGSPKSHRYFVFVYIAHLEKVDKN